MLRDWRQPLLAWALAGVAIAVLAGWNGSSYTLHGVGLAAISFGSWLLANHRTVHLTTQHVELVDRSRLSGEQRRQYPLEQILSHGLIEVEGRPLLRIQLPDRTLALPADPQQLARASDMLDLARAAFRRQEMGSVGDIPEALQQVTRAVREPER